MKPVASIDKTPQFPIEICAAAAGVLALLVLLSWYLNKWWVGALGYNYVPMAPSTAWAVLMFAGGLIWQRRRPAAPVAIGFAYLTIGLIWLMNLLVWVQFLFAFELPFERWFTPVTATVGNVPIGRVSPLTATVFIFSATAFLLLLPPLNRRWLCRQTAALLALLAGLVGLVVLLSYAIEVPLLYDSRVIPMALLSAVTFVLLGFSLLLAAGTDTWPLTYFAGGSLDLDHVPTSWYARGPMLAFLFLFVAIGTAGFFYLKHQLAESRQAAMEALATVADLKADQIANWYQERLGDAKVIFDNPVMQAQARQVLADPNNVQVGSDVRVWMQSLQRFYGYKYVALYGADGEPCLVAPTIHLPNQAQTKDFQACLQAQDVVLSDLHRSQEAGGADGHGIQLTLWVPVGNGSSANPGIMGCWALAVDPYQFLYPLIQSWPAPSRTAETLLIRREGNEVVYLNELRHRQHTALILRTPLDPHSRLPAAKAIQGIEGVVEGLDYRDAPVLASIHKIAGTPWYMVAKVDQEEIFAPLRDRARNLGAILFILLLTSALGVNLLWRQRDNLWLRKELSVERERQRLAQRVLYLNKHANDIILLMDQDWRILEANERALEAYGYSAEELLGLRLQDLRAPESQAAFDRDIRLAEIQEGILVETRHRRKNGVAFPVESSIRRVEVEEEVFHQAIIRDITARQEAEQALRASERRYRTLFDNMLEGFAYCRMIFENDRPVDFIYLDVNGAFATLTGLKNVVGKKVTEVIPGIRETTPELLEIYGRVARTGRPEKSEIFVEALGIWFSISVYGPEQDCFVAVFDNITMRKRAEELLRDSEERLRFALETNHTGAWDLDLDTHQAYRSREHDRIFGYAELLPQWTFEMFLDHVVPEDRTMVAEKYRAAVESHGRWNFECRIRRTDGQIRWILATGCHRSNPAGAFVRLAGIVQDITERKQAEADLRTSAAQIADLYNRAPCGYHSLNPEGAVVNINDTELAWLGYTRAEVIGRKFTDLLTPDSLETNRRTFPVLMARGSIRDLELNLVRKDGSSFPVLVSATTVTDAEGRFVMTRSTVYDLTERKRAEETLHEIERRYRLLYNTMNEMTVLHELVRDTHGQACNYRILDCNPAFTRITGIAREKAVGALATDLYQTEAAPYLETYARVAETGKPEVFESFFTPMNKHFLISAFSPRAGQFATNALDITARKQAEESLREHALRLRLAIEAGKVGVWEWDLGSGRLTWSREEEELWGLPVGSFPGTYADFEARLHSEDRAAVNSLLALSLQNKTVYRQEFRILWPDGSVHWLANQGEAVYDAQGQALRMLGVSMDVTERKRVEKTMHQLNTELEERVRWRTRQLEAANRELEAFSYSVSHDLRAPLRGIDGWSQAFLEDYGHKLDDAGRKYLDRVRGEAQRLGHLIDDLLQLSQVTRAELRRTNVDLSAVARRVMDRLREAQPERRVEVVIQSPLTAQVDSRLLEIVLTNLLGNAFKFTSRNPAPRIEFGRSEKDGQAVFFVRDNGVGFDMAYADKLFGAFQRLHKQAEFPGTGIGLATVQRIIHRHGGSVWAEAQVDHGATFYFTFKEAV